MGITGSKLEKTLAENFPGDERFYGFENVNNTCYLNSVLQTLYFCQPFRRFVLEYHEAYLRRHPDGSLPSVEEDTLLLALSDLFHQISTQKRRAGSIAPRRFITKLRKENELFDNSLHHDAHEFLNYLLNECADNLKKENERQQKAQADGPRKPFPSTTGGTFVHQVFEGTLTNETKCLCCETVTSRAEPFIDLSLEVLPNTSITSCLRNFSVEERLSRQDKFSCDKCCSLQEAQKRLRVKKLPNILVVHLKRFKYLEQLQRHRKLSYRVAFPFELRVCNTSDDAEDCDQMYELFGVVVHIGSGPSHGHYISIIKSFGHWIKFDDDDAEVITEGDLGSCFGSTLDAGQVTSCGYILLYQRTTKPDVPPVFVSQGSLRPTASASIPVNNR